MGNGIVCNAIDGNIQYIWQGSIQITKIVIVLINLLLIEKCWKITSFGIFNYQILSELFHIILPKSLTNITGSVRGHKQSGLGFLGMQFRFYDFQPSKF